MAAAAPAATDWTRSVIRPRPPTRWADRAAGRRRRMRAPARTVRGRRSCNRHRHPARFGRRRPVRRGGRPGDHRAGRQRRRRRAGAPRAVVAAAVGTAATARTGARRAVVAAATADAAARAAAGRAAAVRSPASRWWRAARTASAYRGRPSRPTRSTLLAAPGIGGAGGFSPGASGAPGSTARRRCAARRRVKPRGGGISRRGAKPQRWESGQVRSRGPRTDN